MLWQQKLAELKPATQHDIFARLSGLLMFKRISGAADEVSTKFFIKTYAELLKEYSLAIIDWAIEDILRTDKSSWYPQPAIMIEICEQRRKDLRFDEERLRPKEQISRPEQFEKQEITPELQSILEETYRKLKSY